MLTFTVDPWVPAYKPWPSSRCARVDCKAWRHMYKKPDGTDGIRRYCEKHAKEYDEQIKAAGPGKLLRLDGHLPLLHQSADDEE